MAKSDLLRFNELVNLFRKLQDTQIICDKGSISADALGYFVLSQAERFDQAFVCLGFLNWIEFCPLNVFDEGELKQFVVGNLTDDCRNAAEARYLCSASASLPRYEFEQSSSRPDEEGLNNAGTNNRLCQLFQLCLIECGARLLLTGANKIDFNLSDLVIVRRRRTG